MKRHYIYVRKSTDEAKRQVQSLEAQGREMRALSGRNSIFVSRYWEESLSAKAPGRPVFNAMLDSIDRGEADGILVWDIDRLYRNPVDEGRVRWMLQRGIIKSIMTPTRTFYPADAGLLMAVEGGRAADFIIRHTRNVARGVEEKLLRGEWPGSKPLGYLYDRDKRNIVPDRKTAALVQRIFTEYGTGKHGVLWVADQMADAGYMTTSGRRWGKSRVSHFLTNKLYMGIMEWSGKTYEGKYEPLVSTDVFAKVATALKIRSKPRKCRHSHAFPYCGIFRCSCGSMITAQWTKGHGGTYRYYRCTKSRGVCVEKYLQESVITDECLEFIEPLSISSEEAAIARSLIEAEADRSSTTLEKTIIGIVDRLSVVQEKLNKLTRAFIDGVIDQESYDSAKADLVLEKSRLKQQKDRLRKTGSPSWIEPAREVLAALEMAAKQQTERSPQATSDLVRKIGLNHAISTKHVHLRYATPYDFVAQLVGPARKASMANPSPAGGYVLPIPILSRLVDYLRTHFRDRSDE